MKRLVCILVMLPVACLADGLLLYMSERASKAERFGTALELQKYVGGSKDQLLNWSDCPQVYRGKNTNDLWRRVYVDELTSRWFVKTLPKSNAVSTVSSTLATPTNMIAVDVKGDWKTINDKLGFKDVTNSTPAATEIEKP